MEEFSFRGDYDYCRVPGIWQLSPLQVGEDNSKLETKKLRKIQIYQYGQTKGCFRGFRHVESKSDLYFGLAPLLPQFLAIL